MSVRQVGGQSVAAYALASVLMVMAGGIHDACAAAATDPRLRELEYAASVVTPLTAFVGYHVHLEFAPDEHFVSLGAGDTSALDVGAEGNHLLLKPRQATAGTNLTIITNRRVYFLDYRALARAPRPDEAVYSIVFRYGAGSDAPPAADEGRDLSRRLDRPPAEENRDYWFCGNPALKPSAAADDGLQLRLTFKPQAELPAIFVAEPDGSESLVNFHVENDTIVIHRLASRFVLRRGGAVGCVVDRADRRVARRATGGTVNPDIDRSVRESQP
ncbi:MAG: TrbG/VirB9 family P-type conjugative transfer protein [Proteobacteria bacterium]|nr:TrbG/VirB9 family P-type conjugative transfer protein [Pseudomonadota bacterium]